MRPRSPRSPLAYRSATAATNSSRATILIRLIISPADEDRSGANQMRQHLSFREHFRRGNAHRSSDCRPRRWWTLSVRRHPGADCRLYGEVGGRGCGRRLQHVYGRLPRGAGDFRGPGGSASPEARAVPSKLRNKNSPGTVWFTTAGKSAARWCEIRCLPFAETGRLTAKNSSADYFSWLG